jgi:hypothetical protein
VGHRLKKQVLVADAFIDIIEAHFFVVEDFFAVSPAEMLFNCILQFVS